MMQDMFKHFRDSHYVVRLKSAVDVFGYMHENGLNDFLPHFAKAVKVLSLIPAKFSSCTILTIAHPRGLSASSSARKRTSEARWSSQS